MFSNIDSCISKDIKVWPNEVNVIQLLMRQQARQGPRGHRGLQQVNAPWNSLESTSEILPEIVP